MRLQNETKSDFEQDSVCCLLTKSLWLNIIRLGYSFVFASVRSFFLRANSTQKQVARSLTRSKLLHIQTQAHASTTQAHTGTHKFTQAHISAHRHTQSNKSLHKLTQAHTHKYTRAWCYHKMSVLKSNKNWTFVLPINSTFGPCKYLIDSNHISSSA